MVIFYELQFTMLCYTPILVFTLTVADLNCSIGVACTSSLKHFCNRFRIAILNFGFREKSCATFFAVFGRQPISPPRSVENKNAQRVCSIR